MNSYYTRVAALLACLAATAGFMSNALRAEPVVTRTPFSAFPMMLDEWRAIDDPPLEADILRVLGVDDYLSRVYYKPDGAAVGLYLGYYASQRQGDTIHSPLNCLPGAGWEAVSQDRLSIHEPGGVARTIEVNRYIVQKGLDRQYVLYWYQSHGRVVASEYTSRLYLIHDAIRMNRSDGSLVRVIAPLGRNDTGAAERLATDFVHSLFPRLTGFLPD